MTNNTHKVASMLIAAARALEDDFLHFGISGERVFCSAPSGQMFYATHFVNKIKSILVEAVDHIDYPSDAANIPSNPSDDIVALQAALSATSKRMVFVYRSDGIKVATMGNVDEIYKALFLLRHTPVFILERSVSTFAL